MSHKFLYLPKILFDTQPSVHTDFFEEDISGECLIYPFLNGSLAVMAVNGLSDGFYRVTFNEEQGDHHIELPSILSNNGFAYSIVYDGRITPDSASKMSFNLLGADGTPFLTSKLKGSKSKADSND